MDSTEGGAREAGAPDGGHRAGGGTARSPPTAPLRALGDGAADILVSNPPYIVSDVLAALEPEVRDHEPTLALDGGADGLDAYRLIIADLPRLLVPGGLFALEIGYDQGAAVSALAAEVGLVAIDVKQDLAGQDRVVSGRRAVA